MNRNTTPPISQPDGCAGCSVALGSALSDVTDAAKLREISEALWAMLDDIDTASDRLKPSDEAGYRRFYEYAMRKSAERHAKLASDGYGLFLPNNQLRNDHNEH